METTPTIEDPDSSVVDVLPKMARAVLRQARQSLDPVSIILLVAIGIGAYNFIDWSKIGTLDFGVRRHSDNGQELMAGARDVVLKTVEQSNSEEKMDWSVMKEKIRVDLKRYINKHTSKRPLILPVILEV